jgi:hypothetical protein
VCCAALLNKVKPDYLVLANDNELKGCLYNLQLSGFLFESKYYFTTAWDKREKLLEVHVHLKEKELLSKLEVSFILESLQGLELVKNSVQDREVVFFFQEDLSLWKIVTKAFLKLRGLDDKVRVHYQRGKISMMI